MSVPQAQTMSSTDPRFRRSGNGIISRAPTNGRSRNGPAGCACAPSGRWQPDNLLKAGNTLTQRSMRTRTNEVIIKLDLAGMADGQQAGLCHFASPHYSAPGVRQTGGARTLEISTGGKVTAGPVLTGAQPVAEIHLGFGRPEPLRLQPGWAGLSPASATLSTPLGFLSWRPHRHLQLQQPSRRRIH